MVSSGESWLIVMYWRFMMITGGIYPLVISHSNWNWPFSSLFCLLDMVIFHNYVSVPGDTHLFCKVFDEEKTTFVIVKWTELVLWQGFGIRSRNTAASHFILVPVNQYSLLSGTLYLSLVASPYLSPKTIPGDFEGLRDKRPNVWLKCIFLLAKPPLDLLSS